jgi:hypothetical protein
VDGRPGLYRGTYQPERPGRYVSLVESETGGERVRTEFDVLLPSRENADPSPDPVLMERLASLTGGVATSAASLEVIEEAFPPDQERREPVSSQLEDAWDRWATLILALCLLGSEWLLRKRMELI